MFEKRRAVSSVPKTDTFDILLSRISLTLNDNSWYDKTYTSVVERQKVLRQLIRQCREFNARTARHDDVGQLATISKWETVLTRQYKKLSELHMVETEVLPRAGRREYASNYKFEDASYDSDKWEKFCEIEPKYFVKANRHASHDSTETKRLAVQFIAEKTHTVPEPHRGKIIRSFITNVEQQRKTLEG